tara:strand:+ start:816 stop:1091 length:276 start_codon:yes stop_codon:yes gene_type:complete
MTKNEPSIIKYLQAGYSVAKIASTLEIKKSQVYTVARKHKLPHNSPIKVGGPKEKRILRLFKQGFSNEDIGKIFSQSPQNIKKILKRYEEK